MSTHVLLMPARTPRLALGTLLRAEAEHAWRAPLGLLVFGSLAVRFFSRE